MKEDWCRIASDENWSVFLQIFLMLPVFPISLLAFWIWKTEFRVWMHPLNVKLSLRKYHVNPLNLLGISQSFWQPSETTFPILTMVRISLQARWAIKEINPSINYHKPSSGNIHMLKSIFVERKWEGMNRSHSLLTHKCRKVNSVCTRIASALT